MTDKIVVLSACSSEEEAARIAASLVEKRLAACVNVLPGVQSVYRWKDAIESSREVLLIVKTTRQALPAVRAELLRMHSYETPEVLALAVVDGSDSYLDWIGQQVTLPS